MADRTALYGKTAAAGGLFTIEDMSRSTGNRFFVDSGSANAGDTAGHGTSPDSPFATLDYAFSSDLLTADNGDIVYLMPGHTEAVISAGDIDCDIAGIRVVGLGEGEGRPVISFTTVDTADIDIDAANITFENISFRCDIASLIAAIDVNAANFTMRNCSFVGTDAADEAFLITVITDANANGMTIENCQFYFKYCADGTTAITTTSTEVIRLVGADRAVIKNCYIAGDFTTAAINSVTTASLDVLILDNRINNIATENITGGIDLYAGTTGFLDGNVVYVDDPTSPDDLIDPASCVLGLNYVSNETAETPSIFGTSPVEGIEGKIDIITGYHTIAVADTTTNSQMRDAIGNKTDAAASGTVSSTESLMAYAKQVAGSTLVPAADTTDNVEVGDVVGNKTDAAATGAVTATESMMAYVKQVVTSTIIPAADTTDNVEVGDVIGNKADAAAAGAVTSTESIMAYVKQVVGAVITLAASNVVPAADTTDNVEVSDVVGNKTDAAAAGAVTATESMMAYVKQVVGSTIIPAADTTDNVEVGDVVGNKADAAAAGAVTSTESIMAYVKQIVTAAIGLAASHVVPAADTTDNVEVSDVVGNKTDAAAAGAVSAVESVMAYVKQLVTELQVVDGLVDSSGTVIISKTITSSAIPDDGGGTPLAAPLTGAASGALLLEEITMQTDPSTGLAGGTTMQVVTDNINGLTGATVPIWDEATANLSAGKTITNTMADVCVLPMLLETGKKLYMNCDDAVGTGAGTVTVTMKFSRATANSTIAAAA